MEENLKKHNLIYLDHLNVPLTFVHFNLKIRAGQHEL